MKHQGLRMSNQIQKLRCPNLVHGMEMKVLESLNTTLFSALDVENLRTLTGPQLKILKLDAKCSRVGLPFVFQAVSTFGSSLRYFSLDYYIGREIHGLILTLPVLQTLKLNVGNHRLVNVDFLMPCVSLKYLYLESCAESLSTKEEEEVTNQRMLANQGGAVPRQIQFFGFENILYESNIWALFP